VHIAGAVAGAAVVAAFACAVTLAARGFFNQPALNEVLYKTLATASGKVLVYGP
jgi:hypothetical protein